MLPGLCRGAFFAVRVAESPLHHENMGVFGPPLNDGLLCGFPFNSLPELKSFGKIILVVSREFKLGLAHPLNRK